jgi:hypothetical protein
MNSIQPNKCFAWLINIISVMVFAMCFTQSALAQPRGIAIEPVTQTVTAPVSKGTYRALIIGNNDYRDSQGKWTPLKTAVSDAKAVAELLQSHYGFTDVQLLENANRRDVLIAMQDLSRRIATNDNILLYYAGHGFMDIETNRGYWVPVDAIGTDHTTFLRNSTIRDEMSVIASRAKHTLLVSDSCFSGTLLRRGSRGLPPETGSADLYYQKVANKKSVQIITAGGAEYVDDDYQDSGHSPFTYFLLNELKHNDKLLLTASELSNSVEKAVANNVDQVPESGVLQGAGDEMGEFIFIKVDVHVQGVPKDKVKVKVNLIPEERSDTVSAEPVTPQPQKSEPKAGEKRYIMPIPTL